MKRFLPLLAFWVFTFHVYLAGAQILIPFHLVNGYILLDANVNHVKGKFILDTGTPQSFMINNNLVHLDKDSFFATGKAVSGQILDVYQTTIDRIKITQAELEFHQLENIAHTNFGFMQDSIASDILGTMGYGILKDYVLTIDYNRQIIKLDSTQKEMPGLTMITAFHYTNEGNTPEVTFSTANERKIQAYFDTGSQGAMMFSKVIFSDLSDENLIELYSKGIWYGYAYDGLESYSIQGLSYNDVIFDLKNLAYYQSDKNQISLGYSFLKDYVSVWDFKNKVVTLYK